MGLTMGIKFFTDDVPNHDIAMDLIHFTELLAEYTGTYKKKKMIARMKEVYRSRPLLTDFMERMKIDLKYLIELTYHFDHGIITPQLCKELTAMVEKWPNYPHYWN